MRYLQYIQEEHVATIHIMPKYDADLYVNPVSDDLKELYKAGIKYLRFIADPRIKKLWIYDAGKALHHTIISYLIKNDHVEDNDIYCGFCNIESGKLKGVGEMYANSSDIDYFINNIKWFKKYIPNDFTVSGSAGIIFT